MSSRTRALALGALALLIAPQAHAERALTLSEAFKLATAGNLDLEQARHRLEEAAVGVRQAMASLLPQVSAQGKYTHNYKNAALDFPPAVAADFGLNSSTVTIQKGEQVDGYLNASAPLFNASAWLGLNAAKEANDLAHDQFTLAKTQVMLAVAQTFYAAAGADELLAARKHAIQVAQETLDTAKTRLQNGNATRLDVSRAELALVEAQKSADEALATHTTVYRSLSTLLQFHDDFRVQSGDIVALVAPPPEKRPEIAVLEKTMDLDEKQRVIAVRRWLPTLSLFGTAHIGNYAGFTGDDYYWGLGLQLDWTIYDGGNREASAQIAEAQRQETEVQLKAQQNSIDDEIANSRDAVETKSRSVTAAQREVDLARESLDLVRVRYDAGSATQLDVLQAQDQVVLTEVGLAQARFDLALANLTLERASGAFLARAEGQATAVQ